MVIGWLLQLSVPALQLHATFVLRRVLVPMLMLMLVLSLMMMMTLQQDGVHEAMYVIVLL